MQTEHGPRCDACEKYILPTGGTMDVYQMPGLPSLLCHDTCRPAFADLKIALLKALAGVYCAWTRAAIAGLDVNYEDVNKQLTETVTEAWEGFRRTQGLEGTEMTEKVRNLLKCKWCDWHTQLWRGHRARGYARLLDHVEEQHAQQLAALELQFGPFIGVETGAADNDD